LQRFLFGRNYIWQTTIYPISFHIHKKKKELLYKFATLFFFGRREAVKAFKWMCCSILLFAFLLLK